MNEVTDPDRIGENYRAVLQEVAEAERASGRPAGSVKVVGVSKYVDADTTAHLVAAGCKDLGESRPQTIWQKADSGVLPQDVRWHLVGHLQRNKVRRLLKYDPWIHSVDSKRLVEEIAHQAAKLQMTATVLIEVNISGDEAKTGMSAESTLEICQNLPSQGLKVVGLMAMAGWGTDRSKAQEQFARTRQLRDQLRERTGLPLDELSMGMSADFVAAIAEGATIVRVGRRLFQ